MKRILIIPLVILLCTSFSGCVKEKDNSANSRDSMTTSVSSESKASNATLEAGKSKSTGSISGSSSIAGGQSNDDELTKQLNDLEAALSSLDQITEEDLVIPQPNP